MPNQPSARFSVCFVTKMLLSYVAATNDAACTLKQNRMVVVAPLFSYNAITKISATTSHDRIMP